MKTEEIKNEEKIEKVEATEAETTEGNDQTEEKESKLKKAFCAVKDSKAGKIATTVGIAALCVTAGVLLGKKTSDGGDYDYDVEDDDIIDVETTEG